MNELYKSDREMTKESASYVGISTYGKNTDAFSKFGYHSIKRLVDIVGSLCGIVLLMPLFLFIAIIIKIESPKGPVIFKQTRVGKDEKEFQIYKFRSMVCNAQQLQDELWEHSDIDGAQFKLKKDPRITKVGKFIRKTSIDELPQLWNVLIGNMSLVGPRPSQPMEVDAYTTHDKQRLLVTPGCTGLWQVSGRSNLNFYQMVELDLAYIRKRSIVFDFVIMLKTISVILNAKDTY
jgi:lipopolysaccharide/colanic/teichoic acid biosynthesis glycosyltransferase